MTARKPNPQPSPWRKAPMCDTPGGRLAFLRIQKTKKRPAKGAAHG